MLSKEEKREMLQDALSASRRASFRKGKSTKDEPLSLDEYISFLDGVQKVFSSFKVSSRQTVTRKNRL